MIEIDKELQDLKDKGEAPDFLSVEGLITLKNGYLLENETPKEMFERVSEAASKYYPEIPDIKDRFFKILWNGWLGLATPVASNANTNKALPISCFSVHVSDDTLNIFDKNTEIAMLSKFGGGVASYWSDLRPRGSAISRGGRSDGIIPFLKVIDTTIHGVSQSGTRRGAGAAYLDIRHGDIDEFLEMRKPTGDINRRVQNLHHAVCIDDEWMKEMLNGDEEKRNLWKKVLKQRFETGEPYIFFSDNVNRVNPEAYKNNNLKVSTSNICCLVGETEVLTKEGSIPIKNLCGKTVEIWDGNNWVENSGFEYKGTVGEIYELTFWDYETETSYIIKCNDNHKWVIRIEASGGNSFVEYLTLDTKTIYENKLTGFTFLSHKYLENLKKINWRSFELTNIELKTETHEVYCTEVPTTHLFALSNGLMTGNSEITLYTDKDHTFTCCLSSLNLTKWDEWKDTDTVELSIYFLDAILQEFIDKSKEFPVFDAARRSSEKGRATGLGSMGWCTLLQQKMIPFESYAAMQLNNLIFKTIHDKSHKASQELAKLKGEPEWCVGTEFRNSHTTAVAPTATNSLICGDISPGIEPLTTNYFVKKTAKGVYVYKNKELERLLESKGKNTDKVWKLILENNGSVSELDFLSEEEKSVFKTAREIDQKIIIQQAAQRQKWIDQSQSLNTFWYADTDPKNFHETHILAWELGVKTLYYCRTDSVLKGDISSKDNEDCAACGG